MSIISQAPYYDKYDSSKQYTQLLAVPGRVAQAREITEIQSTMKDIIKSLGDSFLNDGNIIEGCQVITDKTRKTVTVTAGRIYMRGMVLDLKESTIDINASGTELIGIKLKESIIYATDDPDLKDPALGFENFDQPGCDRLKSELELVKLREDEVSDYTAIIATLVDGDLSVEQQAPNYSALNETLARRTFDESGSYIVEGLNVRVESNSESTENFNIIIESGKAYVHGYELTVPSSRKLVMPRATTSTPVTARYTYSPGSKYLLTTGPYVRKLNVVTGTRLSTESVTINNSSGAALQNNTAYKIISVKKDGQVIDSSQYRLEQGPTSYIRWAVSEYPGDNVIVEYYYNYDFTEGTDFKLSLDENNNHYLEWINSSLTPITGEGLAINYDKYLARKDTVYMDQYGSISALQGNPADYGTEVAPDAPAYTLPLASVMSPPGGIVSNNSDLKIEVSNVGLTRFTMSDIHLMLKRIRTIEYDQTVLSLNTEAKEYGTDDKRGIFTDPFIDFSKIGFDFNLLNGEIISEDRPVFDTTVDLDSNMIYLPLLNSVADLEYDSMKSNINKYDRIVSLRKLGEKVVLSQNKATKSFLVAPYLSYPQAPEVFIDPSMDTWFDDRYIEVPVSIQKSRVVSSSTRNIRTSSGSGSGRKVSRSTKVTNTAIGTTVERLVEENVISEESVLYIRPREVNVTGSNYPSNLDNIKCYFEGVETPMTPTGTTQSGTLSGSVKSNGSGSFTAKFTIPEKILTGTRLVEFKSDIIIDGYKNSAFALYQAVGTARTIQRTITTITTVLLKRFTTVTTHVKHFDPDPLAQTFILDEMTLLSGIDIYFESAPEGNVPVTCEIREVLNGNITSTVCGFKTLTADEVRPNISSDSSKATRFEFNDPVLIEANKEYAFVLKSSSQHYRVFVAEIGETDILSKEMVLTNPYLLGVMMSSSNNSSWTSHQKADIKFRLISDVYDTNSEIYFDKVTNPEGFCSSCLTAESLVFEGTSIDWSYSIDGGENYSSITPYDIKVIDQIANDVIVRARLSRSANINLSPLLALDSMSISFSKYDTEKEGYYYVSNLISGLDEYNTVELILDTIEPSSTGLEVYISPSNNNATPYIMKEATVQKSTELNYGWWEKTYKVNLDAPATQCRIFVKLHSNLDYHTPAFRRLRAIMS